MASEVPQRCRIQAVNLVQTRCSAGPESGSTLQQQDLQQLYPGRLGSMIFYVARLESVHLLGMVVYTYNSSTQEAKNDWQKFEDSLGCLVSLRRS